jgi:hypothetical protein
MAGKSRASFLKTSRERDKRRQREEKFQRKLERRQEAKERRAGGDGAPVVDGVDGAPLADAGSAENSEPA